MIVRPLWWGWPKLTLLHGFSSISGTPGTPGGGDVTRMGSWIGFMGGGSSSSSSASSPLANSEPRDLAPFNDNGGLSSSSSPSDTEGLLPMSDGTWNLNTFLFN